MTNLTIVYWRDIPAQIMIGSGRKAEKYKLPEKYEKAIDHCAMKVGTKDSESYLRYWRKECVPLSCFGTNAIEREAAKIVSKYTDFKLKALIKNNGWDADI